MGVFSRKQICPICGRPIRGDVRIKIKDNIELCKACSSEIEMDSSLLATQTVEDIKQHLAYRKANKEKMEKFHVTTSAEAGSFVLRGDINQGVWYCTNDKTDRNPPLFGFEELKSAVYLEDGEPAQELKTGLKSLFGEKSAPTLVQSMKIVIEVDNPYFHEIVVETIQPGRGMTTGTMQYKLNRRAIQGMMECLLAIQNNVAYISAHTSSDVEDDTTAEIPPTQTDAQTNAASDPEQRE